MFWFNLVAGLLVLLAALATVPESADPQADRIDIAGFILGPIALGTAIFAVIHGETTGYRDPAVVALFVVSAVTAVAFIVVEQRSPAPIFDHRFLLRAPFTGSLTVAFAAYFGIFSIFFFTALYLQVVVGYSAYRTAAPVRAHGDRHDRRLGPDRALGGPRRAAPADRRRLPCRRRRRAARPTSPCAVT